jgi:hypothetical protein
VTVHVERARHARFAVVPISSATRCRDHAGHGVRGGAESRDLPLLSLVAVNAAAVADAHELHRTSAILLGVASRLRGAHDRTDQQVRDLSARGQALLGDDAFGSDRRDQLDHRPDPGRSSTATMPP